MKQSKSVLIVLLTGLAVYLTSQLWFVNVSSRNFFYSYLEPEIDEGKNLAFFRQPYRLITMLGNNEFTIAYNGLEDNPIRKVCDAMILACLKDGRSIGVTDIDYTILNNIGYIYEYSFAMPTEEFTTSFERSGVVGKLSSFNSIVFISSPGSSTLLWFIDTTHKKMSGYEVKTDLGTIRLQHNGLIYTASALDNNRIIENNAFVAKISGSGYQYPAIQVINPYADGEILIRTIEKGIQTFFVNPAAKMSYVDTENIITFSDENTVVKYYQNDVLDYANYRIGNGGNNLLRNFGTAISFIELDKSVVNEFYFAGYEKSENGEFTFYFNYVINNLPIFLPDEYKLKDKGGAALQHSIEVTVKAEHVVHYRKLVYRYEPDTVLKEAQVDFDEAVDIELSQSQTTGVLRDVLLGYKIDRNKQAILFWIMPTSGGTLSKAA